MLGLFGIVLSLVLLIYLAYRGFNVLLLAPVLATLAVLFAGGLPILATYTQIFMVSLGKYVTTFFPPVHAGGDLRQADGRQRQRQGDR